MTHPIILRGQVAQTLVDKFYRRDFSLGSADCAHLISECLVAMGHEDPLAKVPAYHDYRSAKKALKRSGINSFCEYLDARFERIAPAMTLPGDIVGLPTEYPETYDVALGVALGQGRVLAFHEVADHGPVSVCVAAWRIPPITGEAA
jgi:hypothetical protein